MSAAVRTALGVGGERRVYGWGLASEPIDPALFYARDIALTVSADGSTDLALVNGLSALEQDLRTALGTALGSDPLNMLHGFDGIRAVGEERDFLMLRERIRGAVVMLLRADARVLSVTRVLIGPEITAFRSGQTTAPPPAGTYGIVDIEVSFRIRGGQEATMAFGPILAGA